MSSGRTAGARGKKERKKEETRVSLSHVRSIQVWNVSRDSISSYRPALCHPSNIHFLSFVCQPPADDDFFSSLLIVARVQQPTCYANWPRDEKPTNKLASNQVGNFIGVASASASKFGMPQNCWWHSNLLFNRPPRSRFPTFLESYWHLKSVVVVGRQVFHRDDDDATGPYPIWLTEGFSWAAQKEEHRSVQIKVVNHASAPWST